MNATLTRLSTCSTLAFALAACGPAPAPTQVEVVGGAKPAATVVQSKTKTLTCYDYKGSKTLEEHPNYVTFGSGYITGSYSGQNTEIIGGNCSLVTNHIDTTSDAGKKAIEEAQSTAPMNVVVTNGSDRIVMAGKFSKASTDSNGKMSFELKDKTGNTLTEVELVGMQAFASAQAAPLDNKVLQGNPRNTFTCFDYRGNKAVEEHPDSVSFMSGYITGKYNKGPNTETINAGCMFEELNYNRDDQTQRAIAEAAAKTAPVNVKVTNGSDRILLSDGFTSVSTSSDGSMTFKLKVNNTTVREVKVMGLQTYATAQRNTFDPALTPAPAN